MNPYQPTISPIIYDEEQMLRGMVIENLTQRSGEFIEEAENLKAIRKYLKSNINRSTVERMKSNREDGKGGRVEEPGSIRDIAEWLNKNGDVMSIGKISTLLRIEDTNK